MTTHVIPPAITESTADVRASLTAFMGRAQPGDTVQNPKPGWSPWCDKELVFDKQDVRYLFEGVKFRQRTLRPYAQNATRVCTVVNRKLRFTVGAPLPLSCNYGYVNGNGIENGTHIVLDADRMGGTIDRDTETLTGIMVTFTSKSDRNRPGFRYVGKDCYFEEATWIGAVPQPRYQSVLEAQHGVDCLGADGGRFQNVSSMHMQGDGLYLGARGPLINKSIEYVGGTWDWNARSGVVPINSADCYVEGVTIDHVGRTVLNVEPPDESCSMDRFAMRKCIIGSHVLTLWSSGGKVGAHVGAIDFTDNCLTKAPMILWLVVGDAAHLRGPFMVARNHTSSPIAYGATYPTRALVAIAHTRGATVVDNTGIILQSGRGMAVVREHLNAGPVVVHGNEQIGGIEQGPWINP